MDKELKPGAERIIAALDVESADKAEDLARRLSSSVGSFKVGKQLFTAEGPSVVRRIKEVGGGVFLDLKFHDIPNTVALASAEASRLSVDLFNVHALGGGRMIEAAAKAAREAAEERGLTRPKLLAVTVLTSMSAEDLEAVGLGRDVEAAVVRLAKLARDSGADGVVASAKETPIVREACGNDFLIVTPGIRPSWAAAGDQRRVVTPKDALALGSDYLVIGRPITGADDPAEAAGRVLEEIGV